MAHLAADLRYAVRSLRKAPLFAAVAVLSMAFGIAANTAVFTLVDQVVLRTLPVARPGELVQVSAQDTESYGGGMGDGTELSYAMYRDLRDHNEVFAGMFCRMQSGLTVTDGGRSELVTAELVSGTFFPQLGVRPAVGRLFSAEEDRVAGGHPVVVLGFNYWMSRFAGDRSVVGRTIAVNGHPLEIIGVVQAGVRRARPRPAAAGVRADDDAAADGAGVAAARWPALSLGAGVRAAARGRDDRARAGRSAAALPVAAAARGDRYGVCRPPRPTRRSAFSRGG